MLSRLLARSYAPVGLCPSPVIREFLLERVSIIAAWFVAATWAANTFAFNLWPGALVPILLLLLGPAVFVRTWRVWDLLVWSSGLRTATEAGDRGPDHSRVEQAALACLARRPDDVRAALDQLSDPSPWLLVLGAYYRGLADLMEKRPARTDELLQAASALDSQERKRRASVLAALLDAGSNSLARRPWRAPILACRKQLGLRLSLWRALWPVRGFVVGLLVVTLALVAVPYAAK